MKACKETERKYYKYQYQDFVQPILTADGIIGGSQFAVSHLSHNSSGYEAYKAFDGSTSGFGTIFTKTSGYLEFYNPNPLKVLSLSVLNFGGDSYGTRAITAGYIQVSNDGLEFLKLKDFTNSIVGGGQTWTIDLSDNTEFYKYYRIIATSTSYADAGAELQVVISELNIIAQERTTIESTQDDYDCFVEGLVYLLPAKTTRNYYKYLPSETFNMCAMTGTFSSSGWQSASKGDNYLYGSSNAYEVGQNRVSSTTYTWDNPIPAGIYVYNLTVSGQGNGYYNNPVVTVVYNNGDSDIVYSETFSKNSYNQDFSFEAKYPVKSITLEGILTHTSSQYVVVHVTLMSKTITKRTFGSESDYDTYEDETTYYGIGG